MMMTMMTNDDDDDDDVQQSPATTIIIIIIIIILYYAQHDDCSSTHDVDPFAQRTIQSGKLCPDERVTGLSSRRGDDSVQHVTK